MVTLAGTCERAALLTDYVIAEKVSALGFLLLAAVYISSASSCLATLYGTPRVLQSIASENVIPAIASLSEGVRRIFAKPQTCSTSFIIIERPKQGPCQSLDDHISLYFSLHSDWRHEPIGYVGHHAIFDHLWRH